MAVLQVGFVKASVLKLKLIINLVFLASYSFF